MNYILSKRKPEVGDRGFIIGNRFIPIQRSNEGFKIPEEGLIFYEDFIEWRGSSLTGQNYSINGSYPSYDNDSKLKRNAATFNGNTRIDITNMTFPSGANPFTISFCIQLNSNSDENDDSKNPVFGFGNHGYWNQQIWIGVSQQSITLATHGSGSWGYGCSHGVGINEWHNFIITYDGSYLKHYVDNVLKGTSEQHTLLTRTASVGCFGTYAYQVNDTHFNGKLSSFRIYNRVLEDSEIKSLSKEFKI